MIGIIYNRIKEYPMKVLFLFLIVLALLGYSNIISTQLIHRHLFSYKSLSHQVSPTKVTSLSTEIKSNFSKNENESFVNNENGTTNSLPIYTTQAALLATMSLFDPCPLEPPKLVGALAVDKNPMAWTELEKLLNDDPIKSKIVNGMWRPKICVPRESVAIIIPYRNREDHLKVLVKHLNPFLQRQQLDFGIFVIDQNDGSRFNRALLFNIGFIEASKLHNFTCFIFHDVDLLPEDDRNLYRCGTNPKHLSVGVDKFNYKLPYNTLFGGVCALSKDQFVKVNGFSNLFFGWGGEDDDMYARIKHERLSVVRYPFSIARYKMLRHTREKGNNFNPKRFHLLKSSAKRMKTDGFSSTNYTVTSQGQWGNNLVYRIQVSIPEKQILAKWKI